MKKIYLFLAFTLISSIAIAQCSIDNVSITSILIDPNGSMFNSDSDGDGTAETEDEFVEICNNGTTAVDIGGWTIDDNAGAGPDFTFPLGTILAPGGCATLIRNWDPGTPPANVFSMGTNGGWLNNPGDNVFLSNGASTCEVSYGNTDCETANCEDWGSDTDGCVLTAAGVGVCDVNLSAPLAVSILDFELELKNDQVNINWSTSSETNNDYFTIEHSTDGRTFSEIEKVAGAGTSNLRNAYQATHLDATNGYNYYRLAQVDFDGTKTYSELENILVKRTATIAIQPTLVENEINVSVATELSKAAQINIINATGEIVLETLLSEKQSSKNINVSSLTPGTYFMIINSNGNLHSTKFMKL